MTTFCSTELLPILHWENHQQRYCLEGKYKPNSLSTTYSHIQRNQRVCILITTTRSCYRRHCLTNDIKLNLNQFMLVTRFCSNTSPSFVHTILFVCVCVLFGRFFVRWGSFNFLGKLLPHNLYLRMPNMTYEAPGNLCQF